jgi:hypothetical protein
LDAGSPSPTAARWIARTVSHPEIGAGPPAATTLRNSLGYDAEPTFFWGGHAARAQAIVRPTLDPHGCLARSVIGTQPGTEETGAVRTLQLEGMERQALAVGAAKKIFVLLTRGRLMGVTVYRDTLSEGFSHFVTSIAAPVASGWSVCRVGFAPTGKRRLSTAHATCGLMHCKKMRGETLHFSPAADIPRHADEREVGHLRKRRH